ncbi:hypothetical protein ACO0SA_000376 [Hanseniaspora valbyensis]
MVSESVSDNSVPKIILLSGEGIEHPVEEDLINKSILINNLLQQTKEANKTKAASRRSARPANSLIDDINDIDDEEDDEEEEQEATNNKDSSEDNEQENIVIPIPNVRSTILTKIIKWLEHHKRDPIMAFSTSNNTSSTSTDDLRRTDPLDEWDKQFFTMDQEMMYEIILASNYLNIPQLLDSGCKMIANMIRGKSAEEIRQVFNIENDFTKEEEEAIRRENEWAEQI